MAEAHPQLNIVAIRRDFPILSRQVHGRPLVYLDNGATTFVPEPVLTAVGEQYRVCQANIHRGVHYLSEQSTHRVERVRAAVAAFLNAEAPEEIVFTSGATDAINLVARAFADGILRPGDRLLTTEMEHHSNLVPWQQACRRAGLSAKRRMERDLRRRR